MVTMIQQKQPHLPISLLERNTYKHGGCMITIGKIPLIGQFEIIKKMIRCRN